VLLVPGLPPRRAVTSPAGARLAEAAPAWDDPYLDRLRAVALRRAEADAA
jgi:hypothetical protein